MKNILVKILAVIIVLSFVSCKAEKIKEIDDVEKTDFAEITPDQEVKNNGEKDSNKLINEKEVILYFMKETGTDVELEKETRIIEIVNEDVPLAVINELIKDNERSQVPKGSKVISTNLEDGLLIVDFSEEFQYIPLGAIYEGFVIASVVQSLLEIDSVDKVKILINGGIFETGHNVYDEPFTSKDFN